MKRQNIFTTFLQMFYFTCNHGLTPQLVQLERSTWWVRLDVDELSRWICKAHNVGDWPAESDTPGHRICLYSSLSVVCRFCSCFPSCSRNDVKMEVWTYYACVHLYLILHGGLCSLVVSVLCPCRRLPSVAVNCSSLTITIHSLTSLRSAITPRLGRVSNNCHASLLLSHFYCAISTT